MFNKWRAARKSPDFEVSLFIVKQPVVPGTAFTPWNFPINQVVRNLSAALATGCSAPEEIAASL